MIKLTISIIYVTHLLKRIVISKFSINWYINLYRLTKYYRNRIFLKIFIEIIK